MTAQELLEELNRILKVHPEVKDHSVMLQYESHMALSKIAVPARFLRYNQKRKQIVLEE